MRWHAHMDHPSDQEEMEQGHCAVFESRFPLLNNDYQQGSEFVRLGVTASRGVASTGCHSIRR